MNGKVSLFIDVAPSLRHHRNQGEWVVMRTNWLNEEVFCLDYAE